MNVKYYDNKKTHGIEYDYTAIFKEYKRLKIPVEFWTPSSELMKNKYNIFLSERSTGKTTQILLLGMVMNKLYGTQIQYIRQNVEMIKSNAIDIFKAIIEYNDGAYIKKLTDGRYNSIYIHWRRCYYCLTDENGKIIEQSSEPFMIMLSIDKSRNYKSSYNAPTGDLIIYDEFLKRECYQPNEFINFMDLLSTIIRKRKSPVVFMLANGIDYTSHYWKELEISKEVKQLKRGEHLNIITEKGTPIYIEIIGTKKTKIRQEVNQLFFGFNNEKMNAITGGAEWSFDTVPHIKNSDTDKIINRDIRIDCDDVLLQVDITLTEDRGIIANIHPSTSTTEKSVILTNGEITAKNQLYGYGNEITALLWKLYKSNRCYFDSNETGALFDNYVKVARINKRG